MISYEVDFASHIRDAIAAAVELAHSKDDKVSFKFNDKTYTAFPTDTYEDAKARAEVVGGFEILTAEEDHARNAAEMERSARVRAEAIAAAAVPTEQELRSADVPTPKSIEELTAYINALVERPQDYGTCVYAMSMAAVAAFNYASDKLGVTGFQASCADLDILRRTRSYKHGFQVIDYGNVLYPQYWDASHFPRAQDILNANPEKFAAAARGLLAKGGGAPSVREHWEFISGVTATDEVR